MGFDLTPGLPGWHGSAIVDVQYGSTEVKASGSSSFGHRLRVGDYLRIKLTCARKRALYFPSLIATS